MKLSSQLRRVACSALGSLFGLSVLHCTPPPNVPPAPTPKPQTTGGPVAPAPAVDAWAPLPHPSADALGDPLPAAVLARLGSDRFRVVAADPLQPEEGLRDVATSGDGKLVAALGPQGALVFDRDNGQRIATCFAERTNLWLVGLRFAAHARVLVAHDEAQAFSCRLGAGAEVEEKAFPPDAALPQDAPPSAPPGAKLPRRPPACAALSPDGAVLARCEKGGEISLWDVASGQRTKALKGHAKHASALAFEPNGARFASGGVDEQLILWDVAAGKKVTSVPLPKARGVRSLAWSGDGSSISVAAADDTLRLVDVAKAAVSATWKEPPAATVAVKPSPLPIGGPSPEEIAEAAGQDSVVAEPWDCAATPLARSVFSPDGSLVASFVGAQELGCGAEEHGEVWLWDVKSGAIARRVGADAYGADFAGATDLVTSDHAGLLRFWNTQSGAERTPIARHVHDVTSVAFSPDGARVATLDAEDEMRMWDAKSGAHLVSVKLAGEHATSLALGPGGALAVAYVDGTFELRDAATGAVRQHVKEGEDQLQARVGFASNGALFGITPGALVWWDGASLTEQKRVKPDGDGSFGVSALAGDTLAVTTGERQITVYDLAAGTKRATLALPDALPTAPTPENPEPVDPEEGGGSESDGELGAITDLALSADAGRLAIVTASEVVVWDVATNKPLGQWEHGAPSVWPPTLSFARRGNWLILGMESGLEVCDALSGEVLSARPDAGAITTLSPGPTMNPGGQIVATGNHSGSVLVWDLAALPIDTPLAGASAAH